MFLEQQSIADLIFHSSPVLLQSGSVYNLHSSLSLDRCQLSCIAKPQPRNCIPEIGPNNHALQPGGRESCILGRRIRKESAAQFYMMAMTWVSFTTCSAWSSHSMSFHRMKVAMNGIEVRERRRVAIEGQNKMLDMTKHQRLSRVSWLLCQSIHT